MFNKKNKNSAEILKSNLPLVLIPGILCNADLWVEQIKYFSGKIDICVADVLIKKSIEEISEKISLSFERFNLIGFSSGGYIAQNLAYKYPKKVNKLILMNTSGGNFAVKQQENREKFMIECKEKGNKAGSDMFMEKLLSGYDNDYKLLSAVKAMAKKIDPDTFFYQMKSIIDYMQHLPSLSDIQCETLIISSKDDPFMQSESYLELLHNLQEAHLTLNEGGGHMLPLSCPKFVNEKIQKFFEYYPIE